MKNLRILLFSASIACVLLLNALPKVTIYSAHATQCENNIDFGNAEDGNLSTMYHSKWSGGTLADTLDFKFIDVARTDSMIYYPHTYGQTGSIKKVALNGAFGILNPSVAEVIVLPLRTLVKSGINNFASCGKMHFYKLANEHFRTEVKLLSCQYSIITRNKNRKNYN